MPTEGMSEETLAFDLPKYGADLKRALDAAGLSYREAERVIGVDHNTLQRVASGTRPPNVEHYLRIERWRAARAEGPAPPGGGGEEDYRGSLRSAPGSTSHRTDGAGERSKAEASRRAYLLFPDDVTHDYEPPPGIPKHPLGKIVVNRGAERYAFMQGWQEAAALTKGADHAAV
jgi:transcriptional regulator with XRE-family HTH domain